MPNPAALAWSPMSRPTAGPRRTKGILGGRSDEVVRQVLDAALVELARSGYAALRMDEVAARAGVNRTTIYRRWPDRVALVTAVVDRLRAPLRHDPLPDRGALEQDLVEAFARRWKYGRKIQGRAWARLLDERHNPEVEAIVGDAVNERSAEWRHMITRAIERQELPAGTDAQLLLDFVHAIVDSRRAQPLAPHWLRVAVRTVVAGAGAGTLVRASGPRAVARPRRSRATKGEGGP
jgi:AcrR family transcriptional regulator